MSSAHHAVTGGRFLVIDAEGTVSAHVSARLNPIEGFIVIRAESLAVAMTCIDRAVSDGAAIQGVFLRIGSGEAVGAAKALADLLAHDNRLGAVLVGHGVATGLANLRAPLVGRETAAVAIHPMPAEQILDLSLAMARRWQRLSGRSVVYTVTPDGDGLSVTPVAPARITERAWLFPDGVALPNGQTRSTLRPGLDLIPGTPSEALEQFAALQRSIIHRLERELAQARDLLARSEKALGYRGPG
jgi:hypothetical protein